MATPPSSSPEIQGQPATQSLWCCPQPISVGFLHSGQNNPITCESHQRISHLRALETSGFPSHWVNVLNMVYKALHGLTEVSSCSSSPCNVHWFFPPFTLGCSLNMPGVLRPCQPSFAFPSTLLYFLPKMSTQLAPSFSSDLYIKVVLQWGSAFILSKMSTPSSPPSRSMPLPSFFSWAPIPVQQLTIVPNYFVCWLSFLY